MGELIYEKVLPITKEEAQSLLCSVETEQVSSGILRAAYHIDDWRWVQGESLRLLDSPDSHLRYMGALCLMHLARIHGVLDLEIVVPRLNQLLLDPEVSDAVEEVLEEIEMFTK